MLSFMFPNIRLVQHEFDCNMQRLFMPHKRLHFGRRNVVRKSTCKLHDSNEAAANDAIKRENVIDYGGK